MKHLGIQIIGTILLCFLMQSCGEDVDSFLEPEQATIVTSIELQSSAPATAAEIVVPELMTIDLSVVRIYNDGSQAPMTEAEMNTQITWDIESEDNSLSVIKDPETGKVKIQGVGSAQLIAKHTPVEKTGNKRLVSNAINVRITEAVITAIDVTPADSYSVGCEYSNKPSTELVVGCLIQFQAIAHFNNDITEDITDQVEWSSDDGGANGVADLLTIFSLDNFSDQDWYAARKDYIDSNQLANKAGLVLGYTIGYFKVTAVYYLADEVFTDSSGTTTVSSPELYSLEAHVAIPGGSVCSSNCSLFENITFQIEAEGTYNNGVQEDIIRQSTITSTPNNGAITFEQIDGDKDYTGIVNIDYLAPDSVIFTIESEGISKTISATIAREAIVELKQEIPSTGELGGSLSRKSNTEIYFLLDAVYNNHSFTVLDKATRQNKLNTEIFNDWRIENNNPVVLDGDLSWVPGEGHKVKTVTVTGDPTNDATLIAESDDYQDISWFISINNSSTVPKSLTINPSKPGIDGYEYGIVAGVPTPFSVMAVFDNQTSQTLDNSQITWRTDLTNCLIELVDAQAISCIDYNGVVETYESLEISAETKGFEPNNISTSIQLNVSDTSLKSISIIPDTTSDTHIYGKDSLQFTAIGLFENGRSHVLPHDCVTWRSSSGSDINRNGLLIADDVSSDLQVDVSADSVSGCNGTETIGRSIGSGITGTSTLKIDSLPVITLSATPAIVNESNILNPNIVTLTFNCSKDIDREITVPYKVTGSSTCGNDHDLTSDIKKIDANCSNNTKTIVINNDELDENQETLLVTLLEDGLINGRLSDENELIVTIEDNDSFPSLTIDKSPVSTYEGNTVVVKFTLNPVSGRDITVSFDVTGDVSSDDYEILDTSGDSFIIPAGTANFELKIDMSYKATKEKTENLEITFSAANTTSIDLTKAISISDINGLQFTSEPTFDSLTCGSTFSYAQPEVNADGLSLVFSIINQPIWAEINFDTSTGVLSGKAPDDPTEATDIWICVKDTTDDSDCLGPFTIEVK